MSDKPPKGPGSTPGGPFQQPSPNSIAHKSEIERLKKLRSQLPGLLKQFEEGKRGRAQRFYPYILIRSVVGDRGDRPINVPFWESPDIWTAPGDPSVTPAIPPDHGGVLTAGLPRTIYAHVWNLGRAPIVGVKVEFYWFNPSLAIDGAHANLIGMTRVDLGPRSSTGCHRLVKCPSAWVPQIVNDGHECLVVRASAVGDNISASHPWDAWADRHVAQRNVWVVEVKNDVTKLIKSLDATRLREARIQLVQVGEHADLTLRMVAPGLKVDPAVKTHVLAELRPDGSLHLPQTVTGTVGGHAPAALRATDVHAAAQPFSVARVVPTNLLTIATPHPPASRVKPAASTEIVGSGADLQHLLGHFTLLSPEVSRQVNQLKPPARSQAQVLRVISFKGDQMVGGYTVVVKGK